jgi:hypothetical protein
VKVVSFLFAIVAFTGCKTTQQNNGSDVKDVTNIVTMQKDLNGNFHILCDNGSQETRSVQEIIDNQVCLGSKPLVGLVYGASDNCETSKLIAMVDSATDCNSMPDTKSWSIKVGDKCINIDDAPAKNACIETKASIARPRMGVVYGDSDNCGTSVLIATVDSATDCNSMPDTKSWSIKVGDKCINIDDAPAKNACIEVRSQL